MFQVSVDIYLDRPIADVFAFIADNENDPQWCVPVVETDRIEGEAPGANTRYTFASKAGLLTLRGEFRIIQFVPPERITWEGESSINRFKGEYRLVEENGGTRLIESSTYSAKGILGLLESSMRSEIEKSVAGQLQNLKQILEE
jgi:carbon monoxide dehydrogenase subunit G